jgi:hypothetical protein
MTDCIPSLKTQINTCHKVPSHFFKEDDNLLRCPYSYLVPEGNANVIRLTEEEDFVSFSLFCYCFDLTSPYCKERAGGKCVLMYSNKYSINGKKTYRRCW